MAVPKIETLTALETANTLNSYKYAHTSSTWTCLSSGSSFAIAPQPDIEVPILRGEIEDALSGIHPAALSDIPPERLEEAKRLAEELVEAKAKEKGVGLLPQDREKIANIIILIAKKIADNVE